MDEIRREYDFIHSPDMLPHNPIKACGLWDTVGSVGFAGISGFGYKGPRSMAPDNTIIKGVDFVFHALSLHERRFSFRPVMMSTLQYEGQPGQTLEQCWFSGYHGDIGGGRKDEALAHLALAWMMAKLERFVEFDYDLFWRKEAATSGWSVYTRKNGSSPFKPYLNT